MIGINLSLDIKHVLLSFSGLFNNAWSSLEMDLSLKEVPYNPKTNDPQKEANDLHVVPHPEMSKKRPII